MSRRFLKDVRSGVWYGSVLSVMQRLDLGAHLFKCQLALNVALIGGMRFMARLKSL
jgi:hypothetical protein